MPRLTVEVPARRRLRWWVKLSVAAIAVLGVEMTFRLIGFGPSILYEPALRYGYRVAPDQTARWLSSQVTVNRFGMRAPERPLAKSAGTLRILMIGDSTLWGGIYTDQEDLYARRLESLMNERSERPVEIWNIAANGWGPLHELGYVEQFGAYDADVAVVCLPTDDLYRPLYQLDAFPYFRADNPPSCAIEEVLYAVLWRYRHRQLRPHDIADRDWSIERGAAAYAELTRTLRGLGCEVLFEVLPSRAAVAKAKRPGKELVDLEVLKAQLTPLDVAIGYPLDAWRGHEDPASLYHDAGHLSRAGHALYAAYLADRLMEVSERCRAAAGRD